MTNENEYITEQNEEKPAFFFIPDISGFTAFIKEANLKEGALIIHDLLETIIDSDILNLQIAEIQGDSIWFYKTGNPVSLADLEKQTVKTFTDFQNSLSALEERYDILSAARHLSLKILVHYGKVSMTTIKGTLKLIGSDSVIAHRIMKNNIKSHEYLLMTNQYLSTQRLNNGRKYFSWDQIENGSCYYEHLGNISYKYVSLSPLRKQIQLISR